MAQFQGILAFFGVEGRRVHIRFGAQKILPESLLSNPLFEG